MTCESMIKRKGKTNGIIKTVNVFIVSVAFQHNFNASCSKVKLSATSFPFFSFSSSITISMIHFSTSFCTSLRLLGIGGAGFTALYNRNTPRIMKKLEISDSTYHITIKNYNSFNFMIKKMIIS